MEMKELVPADDTEALLLTPSVAQPIHIDEVRRECGLPIATVSSTLAMLELKGMVRQVGRMNYVRVREVGPRTDNDAKSRGAQGRIAMRPHRCGIINGDRFELG